MLVGCKSEGEPSSVAKYEIVNEYDADGMDTEYVIHEVGADGKDVKTIQLSAMSKFSKTFEADPKAARVQVEVDYYPEPQAKFERWVKESFPLEIGKTARIVITDKTVIVSHRP